jgi:lipopolysaccharide export system protein LptA
MFEDAMNLFNKVAIIATSLALCNLATALPSDRRQPITIDADSAERDELAGTTTYAGKVVMAQGSMRIHADQIVIFNTKDKVTKIVARGQPASYEQKPSEKASKVVAKANILEYRLDQETLRLLEDASLQQEGTSLSGSSIEYDVRKSVVKADSDANQSGRVRMVIPPKALRSEEDLQPSPSDNPLKDNSFNSPPSAENNNEAAVTGIENGNP